MKLTSRLSGTVGVIGLIFASAGVLTAEEATKPIPAAPTVATLPDETAAKSPHHELLVQAIRERRVLRFTYSGQARVVEPHAYGVNANGEIVLHSFQTSGGSLSQPPPGWRTFVVANIDDLALDEAVFAGVRPDYVTEGQLKLSPLWAEVGAATPAAKAVAKSD